MTGLLEKALRRVEALSTEEQDAIASQILETLEDEEAWARKFRQRPELLRSLAREAIEEHRREAVEQHGRSVVIKPKKMIDPDDVITPTEAKRLRRSLKQTRQGKTQPWSQVKHELGL